MIFTPKEELENRLNTCSSCSHKIFRLHIPTCGVCGCFISAKVKLNFEKCPKGFW